MTAGQPVGDIDQEIEAVYREIWNRVQNNQLYVFPIGISKQANMSYVYALNPEHQGYQMINEEDFNNVFAEIERIVNEKTNSPIEETTEQTQKASLQEDTKDTGGGKFFDLSVVDSLIKLH